MYSKSRIDLKQECISKMDLDFSFYLLEKKQYAETFSQKQTKKERKQSVEGALERWLSK